MIYLYIFSLLFIQRGWGQGCTPPTPSLALEALKLMLSLGWPLHLLCQILMNPCCQFILSKCLQITLKLHLFPGEGPQNFLCWFRAFSACMSAFERRIKGATSADKAQKVVRLGIQFNWLNFPVGKNSHFIHWLLN